MRFQLDTTKAATSQVPGRRPGEITEPGIYYLGKDYAWYLIVTKSYTGISRLITDSSGIRVVETTENRLFVPVPKGSTITIILTQE